MSSTPLSDSANLSNVPHEVVSILHKFNELLQEPRELPPKRSNTHHIILVLNNDPFNVRAEQYPFPKKKKGKINKRNVILWGGPSRSEFFSAVLLVKKIGCKPRNFV